MAREILRAVRFGRFPPWKGWLKYFEHVWAIVGKSSFAFIAGLGSQWLLAGLGFSFTAFITSQSNVKVVEKSGPGMSQDCIWKLHGSIQM